LIIKLGALGDVVRTTPLLRVLQAEVYWVTHRQAIPLLPASGFGLSGIFDIEEARERLSSFSFDIVLSLDEAPQAARLASTVTKRMLIGCYEDASGKISYTQSSSEWFDMGLASQRGKEEADRLKKKNTRSYQDIIFSMFNKTFEAQEYVLNPAFTQNISPVPKTIGIESRAGSRWPSKRWDRYEQLGTRLRQEGLSVRFFEQRATLAEYIEDIKGCDLVVTGDTLVLHIALAFKIKTIGIFTCTSAAEIYDYGRLSKIKSPLWERAFYRNEYIPEAVEAISLEEVYAVVAKSLKS
ncbi:MAG: hypothetical protein KKC84_07275, partial [Candidatus Omnitrophica bacterium]|nr:hypothetical protein [Candidatus Omnitrophota bacterium]